MKEGSVVTTTLGVIFKVIEMNFPFKGHVRIQYIESDSYDVIELKKLEIETELNSEAAVFQFDVANGIHRRLNNLNKV